MSRFRERTTTAVKATEMLGKLGTRRGLHRMTRVSHPDGARQYLDGLWRKTFSPEVHEKLRNLEPIGTVRPYAR
ncbi:hypothetical protein SCMU_18290 [Sinomonas cyclohexanicum]|uniref:Transposase n=1 Tax=Sinomonas cyclohexanicum TaxID=322009 RepID=A0ABM7PV77_SINCY|nr:hypothetical protein [Corynebacterium cyclohexanicum]BCT75987.1 hypothetical protein SCMU_18290 [Corynebacterium cyclohexanicum]